jgi:flavorubredoxin
MTTDATAYCSQLWTRFVPHFGLDRLVADRLKPIPDQGCWLKLGNAELAIVPGHFLHSCGNFQVYDPTSKILYTGDLGASVGCDYREVSDFDDHVPYMAGFHRRYMATGSVMRAWADMAAGMDIEIIAPQHGALFRGKEMVGRFIEWCRTIECGIDVMRDVFRVPDKA